MRVQSFCLFILCLVVLSGTAFAQQGQTQAQKNYAELLARAQKGDPSLDWRALRLAYAESVMGQAVIPEMEFHKTAYEAIQKKDVANARKAATELVEKNYTDMMGHKLLSIACRMAGDAACADREKNVVLSLLRSITGTGDGKSCNTGWEVISIDEEYYILGVMGANLNKQSLIHEKHHCDEMKADVNGQEVSYYFNIDPLVRRYEAAQAKAGK